MMKFLLPLLVLCQVALAGSAQVNSIGQLGGATNTPNAGLVLPSGDLSKMVQLSAFVSSGDSLNNGYMMLSRWSSTGSSGQYQVTTGKTFRALGIYYYSTSVGIHILPGYGTAALGAAYGNTAPTGEVVFSASNTTYAITSDAAATWKYQPFFGEFPALSYPFIKNSNGGYLYNVIIIGTEQ